MSSKRVIDAAQKKTQMCTKRRRQFTALGKLTGIDSRSFALEQQNLEESRCPTISQLLWLYLERQTKTMTSSLKMHPYSPLAYFRAEFCSIASPYNVLVLRHFLADRFIRRFHSFPLDAIMSLAIGLAVRTSLAVESSNIKHSVVRCVAHDMWIIGAIGGRVKSTACNKQDSL